MKVEKNINLFTFPHAGGASVVYFKWRKLLNNNIQMHQFEYSGHGSRIKEPLFASIEEIVNEAYATYNNYVLEQPFSFFGHSMGAIVAIELALLIYKNHNIIPEHLFISGLNPPHKKINEIFSKMTDEELIACLIKYGGMPSEILQNPEFLNFYLPIIRNDMEIIERYIFPIEDLLFIYPITILYGQNDILSSKYNTEWQQYATNECDIIEFQGDHFFIDRNNLKITNIINRKLINCL